MPEIKTYIGCKIVRAFPMNETSIEPNKEARPGYKVIYPDGYESWSPAEVFEEAYREVSEKEITLINN